MKLRPIPHCRDRVLLGVALASTVACVSAPKAAQLHPSPTSAPTAATPPTASLPADPLPPPPAEPVPEPVVVAEVAPPAQIVQETAGQGGGSAKNALPEEDWKSCVKAHESDTAGGYRAVSPDGSYRGAFQWDQGTWDDSVLLAGLPAYVGTLADQAPPDVQEVAASALHDSRGGQPWAGSGC